MNKQPRMIDAAKLEDRLMTLINKYDGKNDREFGKMAAWNEILTEMLDGSFNPDPIPLPTIKPEDTVRDPLYGVGVVEGVGKDWSIVSFPENDGKSFISLDVPNDRLEVIPNE